MAYIEIITHRFDCFVKYYPELKLFDSPYLLWLTVDELRRRKHTVAVTSKIDDKAPQGDIGIMHVDCTVIPQEYIDYGKQFPVCLNGRVQDISKRAVSTAILQRGAPWQGKVLIKSNLNYHGIPELHLNKAALDAGLPLLFPHARRAVDDYPVLASINDVPERVWNDPNLAVEKFIPEIDPNGYAVRVYTFFGDAERCTRYVADKHVVKAGNHTRKTLEEVPEGIRAIRNRLGFDFGKFEFVMHGNEVFLLDANKTAARPQEITEAIQRGAIAFADAFERRYGKA